MQNLLIIALGGSIGAISRFLMCEMIVKLTGNLYPLGTILVNLTGCFLIGLLLGVFNTFELGNSARLLVFTGFLGAFTTFSTFALENFYLARSGDLQMLALNVLVSNIVGILLVFAGFHIISYIISYIKL